MVGSSAKVHFVKWANSATVWFGGMTLSARV